MKDFEGKVLKIYINNTEGLVCMKANFIRSSDVFFVVMDSTSKRIRYLNKYYIRSIEIMGDINEER